MPRTADVVVVGGGIMGASIALYLARQKGGRIWLLEKRHLAAGSSGKSGAILRQHYGHVETIRMAREGLGFYRDFAETFGVDIGFRRQGMIFLVDPRDRDALRRHVALQVAEGVPTRVVDEHDMASIEGRGFYEADSLGCYEEDAGHVDPRQAVEAFVAAAQDAGLTTSVGETVTGLLGSSSRVTGVRTSHGRIQAGHTVLAAGPWTARLLGSNEAGEDLARPDPDHRLAKLLRVVRPQQAFLEPPADFGAPHPMFADLRLGAYWRAEGPRHTRVGSLDTGSDEIVDDPDHYDECASHAFVVAQRERVGRRIPAYTRATLWGGCGALYTVTPDSHPLIGPVPGLDGCTLVAGFSGHGFKLAPAVGRGVAEWILDGEPRAFPRGFFAAQRFQLGQPIRGGYAYGILG